MKKSNHEMNAYFGIVNFMPENSDLSYLNTTFLYGRANSVVFKTLRYSSPMASVRCCRSAAYSLKYTRPTLYRPEACQLRMIRKWPSSAGTSRHCEYIYQTLCE